MVNKLAMNLRRSWLALLGLTGLVAQQGCWRPLDCVVYPDRIENGGYFPFEGAQGIAGDMNVTDQSIVIEYVTAAGATVKVKYRFVGKFGVWGDQFFAGGTTPVDFPD